MLNRVTLTGRLGKDCELRYSPQGVAIGNFNLAVTRQYNREETDWIQVVCFKKTAENTANFTKKGSMVAIDGRIQTRNYQNNDGRTVYVTEVIADSVVFLESKGSSQGNYENSNRGQQGGSADPFAGQGQPIDISDDDLPF